MTASRAPQACGSHDIPTTRRSATLAAAAFALLAGCAAPAIDDNIGAAHAEVTRHGGIDFAWLTTDATREQARADVAHALQQPLTQDDAVRIALSHDPAPQALLFGRAASSADATGSARLRMDGHAARGRVACRPQSRE